MSARALLTPTSSVWKYMRGRCVASVGVGVSASSNVYRALQVVKPEACVASFKKCVTGVMTKQKLKALT